MAFREVGRHLGFREFGGASKRVVTEGFLEGC